MNAETLTALKESIEHWKRIVTGNRLPGEWISTKDCALCRLFDPVERGCGGCPVFQASGSPFCEDTPFTKCYKILHRVKNDMDNPEFLAAAKKELEFLESLVPKSTNETNNNEKPNPDP